MNTHLSHMMFYIKFCGQKYIHIIIKIRNDNLFTQFHILLLYQVLIIKHITMCLFIKSLRRVNGKYDLYMSAR